jgi:hypothetical protein
VAARQVGQPASRDAGEVASRYAGDAASRDAGEECGGSKRLVVAVMSRSRPKK